MRVADYITKRLVYLGIDTCFLVTGGGAMYLNDAIGANANINKIYCHHEQGASIAAEAYARVNNKPALLNVTTGPGAINALNGVFGAFTDSIPMIVISGQVKRETCLSFNPIPGLRQLGDQEVDILSMVQPITKYTHLLRNAEDIADIIDTAFIQATQGRPGSVWIDIPVDLQGTKLPEEYSSRITQPIIINNLSSESSEIDVNIVFKCLCESKRPVIMAGTGVRIAGADDLLLALANLIQVPVATAWTHDIFPNDHPLYAGRPGTIGTRAGNFVIQNADLVIILGSRLNIRQVSYNWSSFARNAKKIWVDIDETEFRKPYVKADIEIASDLYNFLNRMIEHAKRSSYQSNTLEWINWCGKIQKQYSPKISDYPESLNAINAYHFISRLFERLESNDIVVCGDATATIVPFQIGKLKQGMRLFSNSGSASMGYDIPAALGAGVAKPSSRIICLAGDGSSMMNIQELQTIKGLGLNVIVFILNNDGYLSIKQTQHNFFGRETGASSKSGLSFPNFKALGEAFGYKSFLLKKENWESILFQVLETSGPMLCEVELDLLQEFEPRLKSRMVDGVINTPELEDMYPFLHTDEISSIRDSALALSLS